MSVDAFGLLMDKILSWLNDFKGYFSSEVSKISNAQAELATVTEQLAAANATIAELHAKVSEAELNAFDLKQQAEKGTSEIESIKAALEAEKAKTQEALSAQGLAHNRLPAGSLDSGSSKSVEQQVEALRKQMATANPAEKYNLSKQIRELISKKN